MWGLCYQLNKVHYSNPGLEHKVTACMCVAAFFLCGNLLDPHVCLLSVLALTAAGTW